MLDRLGVRHLDDAALAALWIRSAAASEMTVGGAGDPHLSCCAECRVRFDAFAAWMEEIRTDAQFEADTVFTADRLALQQAAIARRLEAAERPARVIAFPKFPVSSTTRSTPVRRWIAAAAAAGLIVGVGVGQLMDLRHIADRRGVAVSRTAPQPRLDTSGTAMVPVGAAVSEEALLLELESTATPQYEALRAYDTLTPRAADFVRSSR